MFEPDKKYLVVQPVGGLGNRLAGLLSCHAMALREDRQLWVNWLTLKGGPHDRFPTPLDQLYLIDGMLNIEQTTFDKARHHAASKFHPLRNSHNTVQYDTGDRVLVFPIHGRLKHSEAHQWPAWRELFWREWRLPPAISEELEQLKGRFDDLNAVVGFQVRAHGHKLARQWNSPKRFMQEVERRLAKNPAQRFFISSDDVKVTGGFLQKFGDRIVAQHKQNELNTDRALKQTIIDLHMLAACGTFLSTPHSGLSYFVSIMRGEDPIYPS